MAKFMKSQSMARKKTGGGQDKPKKSRGPKRTKYENQGDKEAKFNKKIHKQNRPINSFNPKLNTINNEQNKKKNRREKKVKKERKGMMLMSQK